MLSWTESYFKDHSIDSPRLASEMILAHSLGIQRIDLYLQYDRPLEKHELSDFKALIKRRVQNEPVAYITGERGFYESEFKVAKGVLIPRADTETLVEEAVRLLKKALAQNITQKVLELGTGSGAIIVSLAKALPEHFYFANDVSLDALGIAKINAENIADDKVSFFSGSWFKALKSDFLFDLIVSNPPYIPTGDIKTLEAQIHAFEPMLALDGGSDGLDCYREIFADAHSHLIPGGVLLVEMGFDQKEGLQGIFEQYPEYESIEFIQDLAGHNRVVKIKKIN
jgi:release factor glutamine methyltransferase